MSAAFSFMPSSSVTDSVFDIVAQANNEARPDDFKQLIKQRLLAKDGACYKEMEPYLRPPGKTGSKAFDQGMSVNILLYHDWLSVNGDDKTDGVQRIGPIRTMMNAKQSNEREIWDRLVAVLRDIGMRFKHGRLVGAKMLEEQAQEDDGQPDIG